MGTGRQVLKPVAVSSIAYPKGEELTGKIGKTGKTERYGAGKKPKNASLTRSFVSEGLEGSTVSGRNYSLQACMTWCIMEGNMRDGGREITKNFHFGDD